MQVLLWWLLLQVLLCWLLHVLLGWLLLQLLLCWLPLHVLLWWLLLHVLLWRLLLRVLLWQLLPLPLSRVAQLSRWRPRRRVRGAGPGLLPDRRCPGGRGRLGRRLHDLALRGPDRRRNHYTLLAYHCCWHFRCCWRIRGRLTTPLLGRRPRRAVQLGCSLCPAHR